MTATGTPVSPSEWLDWIADPESLRGVDTALDAPRPSPYLARWSIRAQDNDGIEAARLAIAGHRVLAAAQDARFVGGAVGAGHARALEHLFDVAREEATPVVVLLASGGVRLHEANPAELALAAALRSLIDARAAGVPVLALATGDVFGGTSVLACAADRLGMLPTARLGLSGPKVIATAHGTAELDPDDRARVDALFGASARAAAGDAELARLDAAGIRAWIEEALASTPPFERSVQQEHARLSTKFDASKSSLVWQLPDAWRASTTPIDADAGLWRTRDGHAWIVGAPRADALDAKRLHRLDAALLEHVLPDRSAHTVVLVEDSRGHEVSRAAEAMCLSRFLAHHASVLGLLRARGVKLRALLWGQGHSAAFFANALQASRLIAAAGARVMAMNPEAVARVTRLDPAALAECIEHDPVLGHAVHLFAHWGGIATVVDEIDDAALRRVLAD